MISKTKCCILMIVCLLLTHCAFAPSPLDNVDESIFAGKRFEDLKALDYFDGVRACSELVSKTRHLSIRNVVNVANHFTSSDPTLTNFWYRQTILEVSDVESFVRKLQLWIPSHFYGVMYLSSVCLEYRLSDTGRKAAVVDPVGGDEKHSGQVSPIILNSEVSRLPDNDVVMNAASNDQALPMVIDSADGVDESISPSDLPPPTMTVNSAGYSSLGPSREEEMKVSVSGSASCDEVDEDEDDIPSCDLTGDDVVQFHAELPSFDDLPLMKMIRIYHQYIGETTRTATLRYHSSNELTKAHRRVVNLAATVRGARLLFSVLRLKGDIPHSDERALNSAEMGLEINSKLKGAEFALFANRARCKPGCGLLVPGADAPDMLNSRYATAMTQNDHVYDTAVQDVMHEYERNHEPWFFHPGRGNTCQRIAIFGPMTLLQCPFSRKNVIAMTNSS